MERTAAERVEQLEAAFLSVDLPAARLVLDAAARALGAAGALESVLVPALERLGERWAAGTASLSQVYMASRHAEALSAAFLPAAAPEADAPRIGVAVLADHHLLGKRMVVAHLRAAGITPLELGDGLPAETLAERAAAAGIDVLLVSTLLLRAALSVRALVDGLRARGSAARVVVGGAPFRLDPALWTRTGADACGLTAADAPRLALALAGVR